MLSEQKEIKLIEFFRVCTECGKRKNWAEFRSKLCRICSNLQFKKYYNTHKKEAYARHKKRYKINKSKILLYQKNYCKLNKEKIDIRQKAYNRRHRTEIDAYMKEYCQINRKKITLQQTIRQKKKRKIDPSLCLKNCMSTAIGIALRGNKNGRHWEDLAGYTLNKLKKHLEKRFKDGMSWNNYGKRGWEIDHKIPISVFNFTKPEHQDFKQCWALKNLQPMWVSDNRSKGAKIIKHFQPSLLI